MAAARSKATGPSRRRNQSAGEHRDFQLRSNYWLPREKDQRTPRITGRVTNKAGKRSVSTKFEIQLLGDKGQPLLRSPWQESYSLEDGQTVPLFQKAPEGYGLAGLSKTDQNRISGVEIHWKKTYQFSLVKPVSSEELVVMDRDLSPRWCDGVA